jgi:16S rRNA (uracil1498-N3)-methyltransferase
MPRLYIPDVSTVTNQISVTGEKAQYLTNVLRCKKGDELIVFDGSGECLKTRIVNAGRKEVTFEVLEKYLCEPEAHLDITLVQGLLKGGKMDLIIQKTTELGVKDIIPAITERCQVRGTRKLERWRKIAAEASRQSGRSVIPVIHEPQDLKSIYNMNSSLEKLNGFIFYEEGGMSLSQAMQQDRIHNESLPVQIYIGPEGGFTREEIALAKEQGLLVVSFGKRILRAETAAISAVTLIQFLFGDMS